MSNGKRIFISVIIGWIIAGLLIFVAFNIEKGQLSKILLWNVGIIASLAGNGPLLGYDAQGNPMYEGTPVHLLFGLVAISSSFVIYPTIVFLVLTLINRIKGATERNSSHSNI